VPLDAGPGASCFLIELLLRQPTNTTVRTSSDCVLWVVRGPALMDLARRRPDLVLELGLKMSQDLAAQVEQMEASMQVGVVLPGVLGEADGGQHAGDFGAAGGGGGV
jgi:CRP-like cAMP-binding protein